MTVHINSSLNPDDLKKALEQINNVKKSNSMLHFSGKLKGLFGDGLDYQKKIRNEWD